METGLPDAGERESTDNTLAVPIGSRLRAVRRQTGLSLGRGGHVRQGVPGVCARGLRAGERAISVGRLQRLARFYKVPVDQLLPQEDANHPGLPKAEETGRSPDPSYRTPVGRPQKVTIDLTELRTDGGGPERLVLQRFVGMIQMQRQDFNGRMITIRAGDLRVIACLFGFTPDAMERRLDELGLMTVP